MRGLSSAPKPVIPAVIVVGFFLLFAPSATVRAQSAERPPGGIYPSGDAATAPDNLRSPSIRERQMIMSQMEREAARARTPEEEKLALTQIAEDYQRIQVINNKMMAATIPAAIPDFGRIIETTAEIRKRANRLGENMSLPKSQVGYAKKPEYKKPTDIKSLKNALLLLDSAIMRFVESAIFKNTDIVNVDIAAKANDDLETIIEFSRFIGKDAERLSKTLRSPQ